MHAILNGKFINPSMGCSLFMIQRINHNLVEIISSNNSMAEISLCKSVYRSRPHSVCECCNQESKDCVLGHWRSGLILWSRDNELHLHYFTDWMWTLLAKFWTIKAICQCSSHRHCCVWRWVLELSLMSTICSEGHIDAYLV